MTTVQTRALLQKNPQVAKATPTIAPRFKRNASRH
jgi:hypothetical protein